MKTNPMFKEIFLFELIYRRNRPATYVYWGIAFLLGFLGVASSIIRLGTPVGAIYANAPFMIYRMTVVSAFVLSIITSAVISVAIIRDFDHKIDAVLFSTPIRKWDYLMGRFFGSFTLLVIINTGIFLGFMTGFAIGKIVPWEVAWKDEVLLPFSFWSYLQPFFVIVIPNLFFTGALFFMSGALWRNSMAIYAQGILLLILYQLALSYLREMDSQQAAAIIDPFALQTFLYETRYWTPTEQNTIMVPLEGTILLNRLAWLSIGLLALVITYKFFSFTTSGSFSVGKNGKDSTEPKAVVSEVPRISAIISSKTYVRQCLQLSWFYFKVVCKEVPFVVVVGGGVLLFFLGASRLTSVYGTSLYPVTSILIDQINRSFGLFLFIIAVFYSGELVWKERYINFNQISDALPTPSFIELVSKFTGLILTYIILLLGLIMCGIVVQTFYHYYRFELIVYFKAYFLPVFVSLISFTFLFMFIQVISGNKFSGFVWSVVFVIGNALVKQFGLEHNLWQFGSGTPGVFSDMNSFGHFILSFVWFKIYWTAFALVLFIGAVVLFIRGNETAFRMRWRSGRHRFTKPLTLLTITTVAIFLFSGSFIYYNTSILNVFEKVDDQKHRQAEYEKVLKKYKSIDQPRIIESNMVVSLYPSKRKFIAEGFYYLKNKTERPIDNIHVQNSIDQHVFIDYLRFDRKSSITENYPTFSYQVYQLSWPLQPGDSVKMNFKISFSTRGFEEGRSGTDIVYNGMLFTNAYFPALGYNERNELQSNNDRRKFHLKQRDHLPEPELNGSNRNDFGDDASRVRFEALLSTEGDQTAFAPGNLIEQWKESGRNYFRFKLNTPINNFYSIASGRYQKKEDRWGDVNLEIYYHQGHEYNLENMMKGMKDALSYCTKHFGVYQLQQLRVVEFPRYNNSAPSFAGTIPFSEGADFLLRAAHPAKDLDMAYYVSVHEAAHQWWGQQLVAGKMKGNALLTEGLAQYTALMVMKHTFPLEAMERFLKYELDNYLKGRTQGKETESPLERAEEQPYVERNKAALVFYALQDYIGEDAVNSVLKTFYEHWSTKEGVYPSSRDLISGILKITPDSLRQPVREFFETVTLFENKTLEAVYHEEKKGMYEVTLSVACEKVKVAKAHDERGLLNEWIDIGVYSLDGEGNQKLVYLKKHLISKKNTNIVIRVNSKPVRAGVDPLHKLPDRNSEDNIVAVKEFINISNLPIDIN